jgi:carbon-monoxide dehydrogenase medium subunit
MYAEFDLEIPERLDDALELLSRPGDGATVPIAGGTNLIVDLRARRIAPERLVSLSRIGAMRGIRTDAGRVHMGGGTTISDLLRSPDLATHSPSLVEQARVFAGQMVRNTATVAGNICCGSPAADTVPPLLALDARVQLGSARGTREVALSEFFLGYRKMDLGADELVTGLSWEVPPPRSTNLFYKLARRRGDAITVVGVAVALAMDGERCASVRIALGSVAPIVKRARAAEAMLVGRIPNPDLVAAAAARAADESEPIDDIRASAAYRRHGVRVLTRRLLVEALKRLA